MKIATMFLLASGLLASFAWFGQAEVTGDDNVTLSSSIEQRPELGQVQWHRDWEKARKISAETGRLLFVQFQEVPG